MSELPSTQFVAEYDQAHRDVAYILDGLIERHQTNSVTEMDRMLSVVALSRALRIDTEHLDELPQLVAVAVDRLSRRDHD